jgi:hypothetical protein
MSVTGLHAWGEQGSLHLPRLEPITWLGTNAKTAASGRQHRLSGLGGVLRRSNERPQLGGEFEAMEASCRGT